MPKPELAKYFRKNGRYWRAIGLFVLTLSVNIGLSAAMAADPELLERLETLERTSRVARDTIWVLLAGSLVFFMNCGFAMLETGFCQGKNAITVLAKNTIVFTIATAVYWFVGFGLMFGDGGKFIGTTGFLLAGDFSSLDAWDIPLNAKFFFQLTFAGTAATIISGAVAERIRFGAFVAFSSFFILVYSIAGHWAWGGGWLYDLGFRDFAGSTVVHSVGGWAALTGTWLLQPRLGKYIPWPDEEKRSPPETSFRGDRIVPSFGSNLALATLGCFILWLGWFGFNAGSTLAADAEAIAHILLATLIAGAFGGLASTTCAWVFYDKPSLTFMINGILAGCVSITAPCAFVNLPGAALIGFIGGVIVLFASILIEKMAIDDPVGAIPVHLFCGIWGTWAVGWFCLAPENIPWAKTYLNLPKGGLLFGGGLELLMAQSIGILIVGAFVIISSFGIWLGVSFFFYRLSNPSGYGFRPRKGLRVSPEEEEKGIDRLFAEGESVDD
jgi:ammonium transporter, Amt family